MMEQKGCDRILKLLKTEVVEALKRQKIVSCDEKGYVVEIATEQIGDVAKALTLHGYKNRWSMTADPSGQFVLWKIVPNPELLWSNDHKFEQ